MTSLPQELPARLQNSSTIKGAYTMVLEMEAAAKSTPLRKEGDDSERKKLLVFARVVGYLLLEGPSYEAAIAVALEVVSASNIQDRFKIGQIYFNHYILCSKNEELRNWSHNPVKLLLDIPIDSGRSEAKKEYAATIWTIMERFGYVGLFREFNESKYPLSAHIMTLEPTVMNEKQNSGNLCPELITFQSKYEHLPLPDPRYLEIHAACARVCHLSGAAEYINKYEREMEDIQVLSTDGASADILHYALQSLSFKSLCFE
ncbi:hypothetical protein BU17DRAFT_72767 [Hysterangium stoloniferum]|nr:hypothetical protein BU17DRAFT_72767 [Hysterangium stoloniferum]